MSWSWLHTMEDRENGGRKLVGPHLARLRSLGYEVAPGTRARSGGDGWMVASVVRRDGTPAGEMAVRCVGGKWEHRRVT